MPILATRNLKYAYPDGTAALDGAEIEIEEGKKIAFVGQIREVNAIPAPERNLKTRARGGALLWHAV